MLGITVRVSSVGYNESPSLPLSLAWPGLAWWCNYNLAVAGCNVITLTDNCITGPVPSLESPLSQIYLYQLSDILHSPAMALYQQGPCQP